MRIWSYGLMTQTVEHRSPSSPESVLQFNGSYAAGTPSASFGQQIEFNFASSTGTVRSAGWLIFQWTTATDASRTSAFSVNLVNAATTVSALNVTGASVLDLPQLTGRIRINGTQVLGPRDTGWSAWTGTASKASVDTSTGTLTNALQAIKAITDMLRTHGLTD